MFLQNLVVPMTSKPKHGAPNLPLWLGLDYDGKTIFPKSNPTKASWDAREAAFVQDGKFIFTLYLHSIDLLTS